MPHPSPVARVGQFPKPAQQPLACVARYLFDPPAHQRLLPADCHRWVYQAPPQQHQSAQSPYNAEWLIHEFAAALDIAWMEDALFASKLKLEGSFKDGA